MPTIFSMGKVKFNINPGDHNPPHVHVVMAERVALIEIRTGIVMINSGFLSKDLKAIVAAILARKDDLIKEWEHYND